MAPEPDVFSMIFATAIQWGTVVVPSALLATEPRARLSAVDWDLPEHSPGLKAITQLVSADVESQLVPPMDQPNALQVIASSSMFNATQHRSVLVPLDTAAVRRSTRSNKYDGFKVPSLYDTRKTTSKVKPRVIPSIGTSASAASSAGEIPPPTPIATLQSIGVNRCAIPAAELSEETLLAEPAAVSELSAPLTDMADHGEDLSHNSA